MDDRERVEEWADALLEQHRSDPDPRPRWFRRDGAWGLRCDLPRAFAVLDAAEGIGVLVLCLGGIAVGAVAFNSS